MVMRRKFYVVWVGWAPGVYDTWEECQAQVKNYPGARFRAFSSQEEAVVAYRGTPDEQTQMLRAIAAHRPKIVNYDACLKYRTDPMQEDAPCGGIP
ncbi:MAG: RNase H1/viroplasmin domain-containing protein, partial [Muribaculaceae bacterium]|nr:RNase H1/viroplasmin domain-containing protein [Muribaculaceae bacterium]